MGIVKGGALRIFQSFLYLLAFCCAAIILGIYSYFLAVLADRDAYITRDSKAVEGISGAAVIYTIFAVVLTCCLGGISFFAFLGIVLDICFIGGFIALAVLTRQGAYSCNANSPYSPIGQSFNNNANGFTNGAGQSEWTYSVKPSTACRMNKACFAVAIIGAVIFLITALMQVALARNHKKEKRFGPSPSNNYTSGSGKKKGLFARKNKNRDAELGTAGGLAVAQHDVRPSHDTAYTGTTVGHNGGLAHDKVEPNPYGYTNNTTTTGTATNY